MALDKAGIRMSKSSWDVSTSAIAAVKAAGSDGIGSPAQAGPDVVVDVGLLGMLKKRSKNTTSLQLKRPHTEDFDVILMCVDVCWNYLEPFIEEKQEKD